MKGELVISLNPIDLYMETRTLKAIEKACFFDILICTANKKLSKEELILHLSEYENDTISYIIDEMCVCLNGIIKVKLLYKVMPIGEGHFNWKGGKSSETRRLRQEKRYLLFKKQVLKRDNKTCQKCGSNENLHVHHILSFINHVDKRYDIDNGITLCKKCHQQEHNFLFYNNRGN